MDEHKLEAMTVNERLFVRGLLEEYDRAARRRDRDKMLAILQEAGFTLSQARYTVDVVLSNPRKYGY